MIKELFGKHSFAKMSWLDALRETFELAIMPAVFCFFISLVMLYTGKYGDKILTNSVVEFLQLTGIKLTLYTSLITAGLSLILIRRGGIRALLTWVTASICKCGFSFTGVIVGVFIGLAIPAGIDSKSLKVVLGFVLISVWFACFQSLYYGISQLVNDEINNPERKVFGVKAIDLAPWFGGILIILSLAGVITDTWPEVFGA
jgi:hypothetical protein